MRVRAVGMIALLILLITSGASAQEKKPKKRTPAPSKRERVEQLRNVPKGKKPESSRTTDAKKKPAVTRKVEKKQQKDKGVLSSLKGIFNGVNDYFIDKNGDGVSDWWEKKKRSKVKSKSPQKQKSPPKKKIPRKEEKTRKRR